MKREVFQSESGQSLVEIAILIALIALAILGVLQIMGVSLQQAYCRVVQGLGVESNACAFDDGDLFDDDFDGDLSDWEQLDGDHWNQEDGQLCAGSGEHQALVKNVSANDFTVSVDAILYKGDGYGVYFRSGVDENGRLQGYIFQYDPGYGSGEFLYREWINGYEVSPFARTRPESNYQWHNVQRHIEIVVRGDQLTTIVDGVTVLDAEDDAYSAGSVGLRAWDSSRVCFDNYQVTVP